MALLPPSVEPLWIARYDYRRGDVLPAHAHEDYFQLIAIIEGGGQALVDTMRLPLGPGQVYFLRPRLVHGLEASLRQPVRTLDTKFRIPHRGLRAACRRLPAVHAEPDRRIAGVLETMHAEAQRAGSLSAEICQALLLQAVLLLLRRERGGAFFAAAPADGGDEEGRDLASRVHRFLQERCGEHLDQENLGSAFGVSYRHLYSVYGSRYGESPLAALRRFRIERAKQLIRYSDYELKRIAAMSGFATVHHFTRVFSAAAGLSPARWRERDRRQSLRDVVIHDGFVNQILVRKSAAPLRFENAI